MVTPIFKLDSREKWRPQPVETAEEHAKISRRRFQLSDLPEGGKRMDFPDGLTDPQDTPLVGYHRVSRRAELWWHQFWLWYLYNPWQIAGVGRHEGDWEFVQIATTDEAGNKPVLMTASQHRAGEKREFWRCEVEDGRPVVYVALDSHANYFTPGDRGMDEADGAGQVLSDIEWRNFGPWASWDGLWGNSTGAGRSPESPGRQAARWHQPHLYHSSAH